MYGYDLCLVHGMQVDGVGYMAHNSEDEFVRTREDETGMMKHSDWRVASEEESALYWGQLTPVLAEMRAMHHSDDEWVYCPWMSDEY